MRNTAEGLISPTNSTEDKYSADPYRQYFTVRQQVIIVIGIAIGLSVGFGPMFLAVSGIVLKPMASSFSWSRADVAILPMVGMLGVAIGAPFIGYVADRKGWRKVTGVSIVLFPIGLLALAAAPPSHAYIIAIALLTGLAGASTTAAGYVAVLARVFDARLGMAMGFAMIGIGVGTSAMPIIAGKLLQYMNWREAYVCFSGISLLMGVIAHRTIFGILPAGHAKVVATTRQTISFAKGTEGLHAGCSLGQAVRSYRFWLIGVVVVIIFGSTLGASVHMASFASDRGISPMIAAQSAGLIGVGVAFARIGVGFVLDRFFAPLVALSAFLLGAGGLFLLTTEYVQSAWILSLAAVLIGIASGAEGDLLPFLTKKYFGIKAFGSIYGALFAIATIGGAAGPYLYGMSFDRFRSYIPIYEGSAFLCSVCGFSILMLGRYKYASVKAGR